MTTVLDAVNSITQDSRERLALLMGALLEGGSIGAGPFPTGDNGTSYGPFQFHFVGPTKLGLTPQQAQDPALATRAIYPSYKAAVARVPDSLWQSNPAQAAATAAYYAESPSYMYPTTRVNTAFQSLFSSGNTTGQTTNAQTVGFPGIPVIPNWPFSFSLPPWLFPPGQGTNPAPDVTTASSNALGVIAGALGSIGNFFVTLADPSTWWRILFIVAAAVSVHVGFSLMSKSYAQYTRPSVGSLVRVA